MSDDKKNEISINADNVSDLSKRPARVIGGVITDAPLPSMVQHRDPSAWSARTTPPSTDGTGGAGPSKNSA